MNAPFFFLLLICLCSCSAFRFQSAAPLTPPTPSPPAASDINKLLNFDEKRQKDCNDLKRKLQVEKSTVRKLTQEEKVAECQREIDPEAEKIPFIQRPMMKPTMMKACLQMKDEEEKEMEAKEKRIEELESECKGEMEALTESNKEMEEKKRERELPLRGYDLSVLQRELEEQQQQQQQPQQQEPVIELLTEQRFCPHDFSVLCPFAWIPIGDESSCKAPEAYIGSCERQMNFAVSQSEKEQLEDQCLISWPCMKKCKRDYTHLCPEKWIEEDNGICEAPFSYSGRCERSTNFAEMTPSDKERWSNSCEAFWPCEAPCVRDYSAACPEGWTLSGDICEAPEEYNGPCSKQEAAAANKETKMLLEERCLLLFPCLNLCAAGHPSPCPDQWSLSQGLCTPPENYTGPCAAGLPPLQQQQQQQQQQQMKEVAAACGVSFACAPLDCQRDFTPNCPLSWQQQGNACSAPQTYTGPCHNVETFGVLNEEGKRRASDKCNVFWPCANGEALTEDMLSWGAPAVLPTTPPALPAYGGPVDAYTGKVVTP